MSLIILIAIGVLIWWIYNNFDDIIMFTFSSKNNSKYKESNSINPVVASFIQRYKAGERDFYGIDLSGQELCDLNLSGINLESANLSRAKLQRVWLINSNLQSVDLSHASAINSSFTSADLRNANLSEGEFNNAIFVQANLDGANLYKAKMLDANFKDARLYDTDIQEANLAGACMEETLMASSILAGANLSMVNFKNSDLRNTDFFWAHIHRADFSGADLRDADLGRAYNGIRGSNLANFTDADIVGAIMPCQTPAEYMDKYCERLLNDKDRPSENDIKEFKEHFQNLEPEKREQWLFKLKVGMAKAKAEILSNRKVLDYLNKSRERRKPGDH